MKPKGLKLVDREFETPTDFLLSDSHDHFDTPPVGCVIVTAETYLDADQLDKLASRCKEWAKYLRSQKGKKPVQKKWEDL